MSEQRDVQDTIKSFLALVDKVAEFDRSTPLFADGIGLDSLETAELSALLEDEYGKRPVQRRRQCRRPSATSSTSTTPRSPRLDRAAPACRSGTSRRASTDDGTTTYGELTAARRVDRGRAASQHGIASLRQPRPRRRHHDRADGRRLAGRRRDVPVPADRRPRTRSTSWPAGSTTTSFYALNPHHESRLAVVTLDELRSTAAATVRRCPTTGHFWC